MAHLNHKGPEEKGPKTGRKLGLCKKQPGETTDFELGQGMGLKRRKACPQPGKGLRLKAHKRLTYNAFNNK